MLIQNDKHPLAYSIVFSYSYLLLRNARYEEAIDMLKRGITLNPNVPEFYTNIAYALSRMHKHEESIPYYKKAIEIKPDHYKSLFDLGLVYLRLGDFAQGWKLHEYRNYRPAPENFSDRYLQGKLPRWDGNPESLRGKKVFVSKEQGFGDGMQFFRYVEPLSKIASHVTFSCEPYLKKLFEASNIWDNVTITDDFENVEPHDVWLYQMSLPVVVPEVENRAYLKAMPDTPVPKLPDGGFKVGIAWQGNPKHINDKNRSLKLSQFDHFPKKCNLF